MGLTYNGTEVQEVTYNGSTVNEIVYNGVIVWPEQKPVGIFLVDSAYGIYGRWGEDNNGTLSLTRKSAYSGFATSFSSSTTGSSSIKPKGDVPISAVGSAKIAISGSVSGTNNGGYATMDIPGIGTVKIYVMKASNAADLVAVVTIYANDIQLASSSSTNTSYNATAECTWNFFKGTATYAVTTPGASTIYNDSVAQPGTYDANSYLTVKKDSSISSLVYSGEC